MRHIVMAAILALAGLAPGLAADVSGKWTFTLEISGVGTFNPNFEFKQDGEKLTGKYSGGLGNADLTGTVKGDQIEFSFKADYNGDPLTVVYKGTVESGSKMKGTAKLGDMAEASWTGEKK